MHKETREQTEGEKKLSQLLGEYMEEKKKNPEGFLEISTVLMCAGGKALDVYMVSKYFGFIEWLVQNDKVEKACLFFNTADLPDDNVSKILMLLAIQDEPVKFLSEMLK